MTNIQKIRICMVAGSMALQGVVVGKMMKDYFDLGAQATYLIDVLAQNDVQLTEFDMVAMTELGFKFRDQT
jgi:hypothetical protein